jgi:hypothetical protein
MAAYSGIITFGTSPIQLTDPANGVVGYPLGQMARRVFAEPLRGNTATSYIGLSNVTNTGSGPAIQELAAPVTNSPLDRYDDRAGGGSHNIDPSQFWVNGTSRQKVKVTIFTI